MLMARQAPVMAQEVAGYLDLGRARLPILTLTPPAPVSEMPHVFLHGGAWCMGSSRSALGLLRRMAHQCRRPIVSLDYPLAPEHPYPEAIDATARAFSILADSSGIAGVIASSAGGHVALAALMRLARSAPSNGPKAVLLWNPALALHADSWTHDAFGVGFGLTTDQMIEAYGLYGVPTDDLHRDITEMDLSGLPPVWIACGDRDPLLADSLRVFESLTRTEATAHLAIIPQAVHGFMNQWFDDTRSDAAVTHALDWLEMRCNQNPEPIR